MIHSNLEKNISVAINAYHAEKHLPQVEDSMKHFDEIIVCDMETLPCHTPCSFDRDKIGSSYQQINQSSQTDLEMQLRWRF